VNCHFTGDEVLYLDDLHIQDKTIHPPYFSLDLIFWIISFPPIRWRTVNYRNRGLGVAVIQFLVDFARSKSAKRIEGKVKAHDYTDNPDLPNWYRRRGFSVVRSDAKAKYVAMISMDISAASNR
jgi:GNAT superfamily N-acetyltransferase